MDSRFHGNAGNGIKDKKLFGVLLSAPCPEPHVVQGFALSSFLLLNTGGKKWEN
jgi:hypothetical protein